MFYVYILYCNNHSYYTGYTTNIVRRYQEHLDGIKCKYTRSFKPLYMAQCWQLIDCKSTAMKMEKFIKQLNKNKKKELILHPHTLNQLFSCQVYPFELVDRLNWSLVKLRTKS